ncbi:hypothetical protein A2U01_0095835, partial [Trifolium medium]|nr:hypothetical protein [Trifolium medium]
AAFLGIFLVPAPGAAFPAPGAAQSIPSLTVDF